MTVTKHAFLEGMGLGVLAGAAVGMAVAAKGMQDPNVRRAVRQTGRKYRFLAFGLYARKRRTSV